MKYSYLVYLASVLCFCSCQQVKSSEESQRMVAIDSTFVEKQLATLASDEFEGRKPFSAGETKTINYLKTIFESLGLDPGNGDSYFQPVPMVKITGYPDETLTIKGKGGSFVLKYPNDFVTYTEKPESLVQLNNSELVFCGYGIVAPEYGWNDYEGIDMRGKTAVVMINDPGFQAEDSTLFKGNTMTYYGRWTYKYEEAARQGAAGCLIIHETNAAGYPWFVIKSSWSGGKLNLESNTPKCEVQGWISLTTASNVFKASGIEGGKFLERAKTKGFKPIPLGINISTKVRNELERNTSNNVVGIIKGGEKPDEYVIYTAHWDHFGIGEPVAGDSIYNGALDNATGTSGLLGIAKAFTSMPKKPKRSVVFLAVTAEEQGLLGSAYYAENPIYTPEQTVANINIDGMNYYGATNDISIVGLGQSDMDDLATVEAKKQGRYVRPDSQPEKGFFFRSDQFNFAKIGIPVLFINGGIDHKTKGETYVKALQDDFTANHYHRPSDHYNPATWDLSGMMEDAQLLFNLGYGLSNSSQYPQWKEGSEFKDKRKNLID